MSHRGGSIEVFVLGAVLVLGGCSDAGVSEPELEGPRADCAPTTLLGMPTTVRPIWCQALVDGPATFQHSGNRWEDDFDHGLSFATLGGGYVAFDRPPAFADDCSASHFRHNDHWMVDLGVDGCDGVLMRPEPTFRFQDGKLVIEATFAAAIEGYGPNVWGEMIVTNASEPTATSNGELYAYTMFPDDWAFGCRLQAGRVPVCAVFDDSGRGSGDGGRTMEISFFQHEGAAEVFGGEPGPAGSARDLAWRTCGAQQPDIACRDTFRLELERDAVTLFVNGVRYMAHTGLPEGKGLPDALVSGDVHVYFASWSWRMGEVADGARFHWDRLAVNP